jgi:hypothetical protein
MTYLSVREGKEGLTTTVSHGLRNVYDFSVIVTADWSHPTLQPPWKVGDSERVERIGLC